MYNIFLNITGAFGKILYTGDFRWCNSMKENPFLKTLSESRVIFKIFISYLKKKKFLIFFYSTEFRSSIRGQHF